MFFTFYLPHYRSRQYEDQHFQWMDIVIELFSKPSRLRFWMKALTFLLVSTFQVFSCNVYAFKIYFFLYDKPLDKVHKGIFLGTAANLLHFAFRLLKILKISIWFVSNLKSCRHQRVLTFTEMKNDV